MLVVVVERSCIRWTY